ncbi:MAG: GTPase ObgE [Nitrospinota bacterium]|nr:GTPase ObgE [Nitrospinota bacterium]
MFIDTARLLVEAGKGGDGCLSFRREKFIPKGGPDGGDGGRGGHVVFKSESSYNTLYHLRNQSVLRASDGGAGMSSHKHGANGDDLYVSVPVGTIIRDSSDESVIYDFEETGQEFVVAKGGRGGLGNDHFKSSRNRAPRRITKGQEGEELSVGLEIKLLADVGLIGKPNAGKSTLISTISKSRPKIAEYPFTTIEPNLGVVDLGGEFTCVVADIPGLILGAHSGKGLGHQFLRHIERCSLLLHLLDSSNPTEAVFQDFDSISRELELFSKDLIFKKRVCVLTKVDVIDAEDKISILRKGLKRRGFHAIGISSVSKIGLKELLRFVSKELREI